MSATEIETMPDEEAEAASSTFLTADLGGQVIGIDVRHVREILDCRTITRLPNAPMDVLGVIDVRGESVPIVDIEARLGMAMAHQGGDEARIVVLELGPPNSTHFIGFRAERVRNVEQIGPEAIEDVPTRSLGGWDAGALSGLYRKGAELIVLVDLDRVFRPDTEAVASSADGFGFF